MYFMDVKVIHAPVLPNDEGKQREESHTICQQGQEALYPVIHKSSWPLIFERIRVSEAELTQTLQWIKNRVGEADL